MSVIRLLLIEHETNMDYEANFHSTLTDLTDIANLFTDLPLRYSNLLINPAWIQIIQYFGEEGPQAHPIDAEVINLPGARLPVADVSHLTKTTGIYYTVESSDNILSRRYLPWCFYLEDVNDDHIALPLQSYLETYLDDFYDNTDYEILNNRLVRVKFKALNPKLRFRKSFRYPQRTRTKYFPTS